MAATNDGQPYRSRRTGCADTKSIADNEVFCSHGATRKFSASQRIFKETMALGPAPLKRVLVSMEKNVSPVPAEQAEMVSFIQKS